MPIPTDRSAALARLRAYLAMEPGSAPPSHDDLRVLITAGPAERQSFDFAAEGGLRVLQMRVAKLQQLEADIAFMRRHAPTAAEVCDAVGAYWRELGVKPKPWSLSDVLMHAARASQAADWWEVALKELTDILGISGDDRTRAAQQLADEHRRLTTENERLRTALAAAGLDSARRDLMAIGEAADAFHRDVGAEPGSLTPAQIIAAAARHYLDAEHLRSESNAIAAALAESPVPTCPPDCDLAGWIRYAVRGWMAERAEGNHLADLCQNAHNALTAAGVPNEGTPAERIEVLRRNADSYSEVILSVYGVIYDADPSLSGQLADRVRHICRDLADARAQLAHPKAPAKHLCSERTAIIAALDEFGYTIPHDDDDPIGWVRSALERKAAELNWMVAECAQLRHERTQLQFEIHQLREQLAHVQAPAEPEPMQAAWPIPPDYLLPDGPDLACPGCGGRVHWGGIGEDGVGAAHCARSSFACTRADQPEIGDGTCEWSGRVRRVEGGGVEVAP